MALYGMAERESLRGSAPAGQGQVRMAAATP